MPLTIGQTELEEIRNAKRDVFLGIICIGNRVRVRLSDAVQYPGHLEWLAKDAITDAQRGFSLLVRDGRVWAIFSRSRLNPASDARLEADLITEVLSLLPVEGSVQVLE